MSRLTCLEYVSLFCRVDHGRRLLHAVESGDDGVLFAFPAPLRKMGGWSGGDDVGGGKIGGGWGSGNVNVNVSDRAVGFV